MVFRKHSLEKFKASVTEYEGILLNGIACGHLVHKSAIVNIYKLPLCDGTLIGPIISIATFLNGLAGISVTCNLALGNFPSILVV